jgi:hypothetical protein
LRFAGSTKTALESKAPVSERVYVSVTVFGGASRTTPG